MSYSEACRVVPCTNELILCLLCIAVTSIVGNSEYTGENQYCEVILHPIMFNLHQTISQLVSSSGVSVQSKSRLKAIKTPPWASLALSFRTASKESGKISEFLIIGVNQDSFPKMMSRFACMKFSLLILY